MKIIISSRYLYDRLSKIICKPDIKKVRIKHGLIMLDGNKIVTHDNLSESYIDEFPFYPVVWVRLMDFLKDIPEQPITLTIYDDMIDVYCSVRFKF